MDMFECMLWHVAWFTGALSQLLSGWIRPAKCVLLEPELLENA